jgi:predicted metalloprotease with PDZ domain
MLGIKTAGTTECRVTNVFDGSAAQDAGISGGDVLVAFNGLRVTPGNIDALLARYQPGDTVDLLVFRRDEIVRFEVRLGAVPPPKFMLKAVPKPPKSALTLRQGWLQS